LPGIFLLAIFFGTIFILLRPYDWISVIEIPRVVGIVKNAAFQRTLLVFLAVLGLSSAGF
jgi:hypothetical protein